MAGDKAGAGIACTMPLHLKDPSGLAEVLMDVCHSPLCLHNTGVTDPAAVSWCEQRSAVAATVTPALTSYNLRLD